MALLPFANAPGGASINVSSRCNLSITYLTLSSLTLNNVSFGLSASTITSNVT